MRISLNRAKHNGKYFWLWINWIRACNRSRNRIPETIFFFFGFFVFRQNVYAWMNGIKLKLIINLYIDQISKYEQIFHNSFKILSTLVPCYRRIHSLYFSISRHLHHKSISFFHPNSICMNVCGYETNEKVYMYNKIYEYCEINITP